ncbi:hypothetical protein QFC19_001938 [Naganishia cerealis]|uniref:Uncharacterized protein n=1 Tax=Naganishia cerealis TaxID=610337 RepID=A0ACC2WE09_9TREE|nr:hypothetical protein QFC19_001938 [Naganishia cerealis]
MFAVPENLAGQEEKEGGGAGAQRSPTVEYVARFGEAEEGSQTALNRGKLPARSEWNEEQAGNIAETDQCDGPRTVPQTRIAFKREFKFNDVIRLWDVLFTDYYSNEFVIFIALAILHSHREVIIRYLVEFDEVLKYANDLSETIDLESTLAQAEVNQRPLGTTLMLRAFSSGPSKRKK